MTERVGRQRVRLPVLGGGGGGGGGGGRGGGGGGYRAAHSVLVTTRARESALPSVRSAPSSWEARRLAASDGLFTTALTMFSVLERPPANSSGAQPTAPVRRRAELHPLLTSGDLG